MMEQRQHAHAHTVPAAHAQTATQDRRAHADDACRADDDVEARAGGE